MNTDTSKVLFSTTEDNKLVKLIAKFPCIYDYSCEENKNYRAKDAAWEKIEATVERSEADCKKRWRNIKDTYQKRQRKLMTGPSRKSNARKWPLANMLSFLDKPQQKQPAYKSDALTDDTTQEEEQNEKTIQLSDIDISYKMKTLPRSIPRQNSSEISAQEALKTSKPIVHVNRRNDQNRDDDDTDLFFKSIAMSVKKLKPEFINEAKINSLKLLFDLERRNNAASNTSRPAFYSSESS